MPYDPKLDPLADHRQAPLPSAEPTAKPATLRELADRARASQDGQALACSACGCQHRIRQAGQWRCRNCGLQI